MTSPRRALPRREQEVSNKRESCLDRYPTWVRRGPRHCLAAPHGSGKSDLQDLPGQGSVVLSRFRLPKRNPEVCLPTSSSPMLLTRALQTASVFPLSNPFLSLQTPHIFYAPGLACCSVMSNFRPTTHSTLKHHFGMVI